ncbi:MAG TPA: PAS domain S-box protein [Syntrophomonadaceae bacterium]|nr:PAS domain S-box protein [Syntrophomonadaceae bacterium]
MKKPSDGQDLEYLREKLIGLGESSFRKSYYPELQQRQQDLERFRALLDQSNDAIFLIQIPSRRLTDINESACRQLEYSQEELLNMLVDDLVISSDKGRLKGLFSGAPVRENKPIIVTTRLRKHHGDQIPVEATIRQVAFDDVLYAVVVARDISERQATEEKIRRQNQELQAAYLELSSSYQTVEAIAEELEESQQSLIAVNAELSSSQERLEQALWGARAGLWDWQMLTGTVTVNHRYREICGYDSQESEHAITEWEARIHPGDLPDVQDKLYSHLEGRVPFYEAEYRTKGKDGDWIWLLDSGRVVNQDESGQAVRAVGIVQEITERKQVEQSLASSKAIYHGIFNVTSNPVFLMNELDFTILDANPAAQRIFGYDLNELKQMNGTMLSHQEPKKACQALTHQVKLAIQQGTSTIKEIASRKTGELVPIMITFTIIPVEEQNVVMALVQDLSEESRYQLEREKASRYEAQVLKMTTLGIMSAGVVHEISQPLNAIKVLADGMLFWQEMGREMDSAKSLDAFHKISLQAERINEIIRHMRNLASTGKDREFSPSDLNSALTGTMQMLGQQLEAHGIEMELDLGQHLAPFLGQEERMEEVIINLMVNAMNALDQHRQENKRITCRTHQEGSRVILELADNGPGISPELDHQIWEPFFSTRKGGHGMGLGLVIVQSIVSSLGGNITHHNNEWGGATFRLELPAMSD